MIPDRIAKHSYIYLPRSRQQNLCLCSQYFRARLNSIRLLWPSLVPYYVSTAVSTIHNHIGDVRIFLNQ